MADADAPAGGLTGMDWLVIVAAGVSLALAVTWLVKGKLPEPATAAKE